jgi:hypothetical protein
LRQLSTPVVLARLTSHQILWGSSVTKVEEEVEAGRQELTPRTPQRLEFALQDAVEDDPEFAELLQDAVSRLQSQEAPSTAGGTTLVGNTFSGPTVIQTRLAQHPDQQLRVAARAVRSRGRRGSAR